MLSVTDDFSGAGVSSTATSLGALRPGTPQRNLAMDGARAKRARLFTVKVGWASLATIEGDLLHTAAASLCTSTARFGTVIPFAPSIHDTVNGASVGVAFSGFGESTTSHAAMSGFCDNSTLASVSANTTRLCAGRPSSESGKGTVDRAGVSAARASLRQQRANLATVGNILGNRAATAHASGVTRLGTSTPGRECRNGAINRTWLLVAVTNLTELWALVTAVGRDFKNLASTAVHTLATGEGAFTPSTPG